jgi:hypothetical protein
MPPISNVHTLHYLLLFVFLVLYLHFRTCFLGLILLAGPFGPGDFLYCLFAGVATSGCCPFIYNVYIAAGNGDRKIIVPNNISLALSSLCDLRSL